MRLFWALLAVLFVLGLLLAVPVIAHRAHPARDCRSQIVTMRTPHGQAVECICIGGLLSTGFHPRPWPPPPPRAGPAPPPSPPPPRPCRADLRRAGAPR